MHQSPLTRSSDNPQKRSRIPRGSVLFEKIIPLLLIAMSIVMGLLVLFAAGVLMGIIRF